MPSKYRKENPELKQKLDTVFAKQKFPELKDGEYGMIDAKPASGSSALYLCDIADGNRHAAILTFQSPWDLAVGALYARDRGCPVVLLDNKGMPTNDDVERVIALAKKDTLINIAVYANTAVKKLVEDKFYA